MPHAAQSREAADGVSKFIFVPRCNLVPNLLIGNELVLETLFPLGELQPLARFSKRSFADTCVPNQEIGNEDNGRSRAKSAKDAKGGRLEFVDHPHKRGALFYLPLSQNAFFASFAFFARNNSYGASRSICHEPSGCALYSKRSCSRFGPPCQNSMVSGLTR